MVHVSNGSIEKCHVEFNQRGWRLRYLGNTLEDIQGCVSGGLAVDSFVVFRAGTVGAVRIEVMKYQEKRLTTFFHDLYGIRRRDARIAFQFTGSADPVETLKNPKRPAIPIMFMTHAVS